MSDPPGTASRPPVVEIRQFGTVTVGEGAAFDQLRRDFVDGHCVRLPGLLEPFLAEKLLLRLDEAKFIDHTHEGIGRNRELCLRSDAIAAVLQLLMNSAVLFRAVQEITGCGRIGSFVGRVYRMASGQGHHDAWHDDVIDCRLVGLSANLSRQPFQGGTLQIRDRTSRSILCDMANPGFGDALLFRLRADLQHRVTDVEGSTPRTAFAGWFRSPTAVSVWPSGLATVRA